MAAAMSVMPAVTTCGNGLAAVIYGGVHFECGDVLRDHRFRSDLSDMPAKNYVRIGIRNDLDWLPQADLSDVGLGYFRHHFQGTGQSHNRAGSGRRSRR